MLERSRMSLLALFGLGVILLWYAIMLGSCLFYLKGHIDPQGWDALPLLAAPGVLSMPFGIIGGLLGVLAWVRIQARPAALKGRWMAIIAIGFSLAAPAIAMCFVYLAPEVKKWLWS